MVYVGSGTLVHWEKKRCLLMAAHVWESFRRFGSVGPAGDRPELVMIRDDRLSGLHCSRRIEDEWGPDLALNRGARPRRGRSGSTRKGVLQPDPQAGRCFGELYQKTGWWAVLGAPAEFVMEVGREPEIGVTHFSTGVTLIASA